MRASLREATGRLAALAVLLAVAGCGPAGPARVEGPEWVVTLQSDAPDDPPDDSLYFELVDNDAVDGGFVEVAVQLHRLGPRLVQAGGTVTYGGGTPPSVAYREWRDGYFFERCRIDVRYDIDDLGPTRGLELDVDIPAMGTLRRFFTGSCDGAADSGALLILRFELLRPGTTELAVAESPPARFTTTGGATFPFARTYGARLVVGRR